MSLVLHSSAVLEWIYAEKTTPARAQAMETVIAQGAWVPAHWRLEIVSVLEQNTRRGRHDHHFRDATLQDLALLALRVDPETHAHAGEATLRLAVKHDLTVYDAAYLELAMRRGLPLATVDPLLRRVARREDVAVVG